MSENIFSSFYNKVLGFFQKETNQDSETAKDTATNRLKLVLMQDRSNLDGATMQKMREQLISVISKYIEIDQEALDLNLESDGDEIALMLNIPVIRARTKEEIEKLEEEASKAKEEQTEEDAESEENEEAEESEEQPAEENEAESVEETEESEETEDTIEEEISEEKEEETENVEAKGEETENVEAKGEETSLEDSVQETKKSKKQKNK